MNIGCVPFERGNVPWKAREADVPPSGAEFEQFSSILEGFLCGFYADQDFRELPVYCQGDFYGERTEALHMTGKQELSKELEAALSRWLQIPRWQSWRIVVPAAGDLVIYPGKVIRTK